MENRNQNVSPPPPPDISVRTMNSDILSLETSGGTVTAPEFFNLEQKETQQIEGSGITGYGGPEKPIFSRVMPQIESSESPGMSLPAIAGIAIGIIILFGVLGYAVVFPILFGE